MEADLLSRKKIISSATTYTIVKTFWNEFVYEEQITPPVFFASVNLVTIFLMWEPKRTARHMREDVGVELDDEHIRR